VGAFGLRACCLLSLPASSYPGTDKSGRGVAQRSAEEVYSISKRRGEERRGDLAHGAAWLALTGMMGQ
jgi:hypothetical protein